VGKPQHCSGSDFSDTTGAASGYVLFPVEWGADSVEVRVRVEGAGERVLRFARADRLYHLDLKRRRWLAAESGSGVAPGGAPGR